MRIPRVVFLLSLLATFVVFPVAASERYTNEKLNFSVVTPGADWEWSPVANDAADGIWAVTAPRGDRFSVAVSEVGRYRLSEDWIVEMQRDVRREAQHSGGRIEQFHHERAGSPIFPSFSYSYIRIYRDGRKAYVEGYIGATNRIYTLQYSSYDRELVTQFRQFVASFQLADRLEGQRAPNTRTGVEVFPGTRKTGMSAALGVPIAPNATTAPPPPTH
jgi:hypothetical protein